MAAVTCNGSTTVSELRSVPGMRIRTSYYKE